MHACVLDLIDCHKTTGARRKHSPAERARYLNIIPVRCPMPEETNCRRHHLLAADGDKPRTRRASRVAVTYSSTSAAAASAMPAAVPPWHSGSSRCRWEATGYPHPHP